MVLKPSGDIQQLGVVRFLKQFLIIYTKNKTSFSTMHLDNYYYRYVLLSLKLLKKTE